MKKRMKVTMFLGLFVGMVLPCVSAFGVTAPATESFESWAIGGSWTTNGTGRVATSTFTAIQGSQSVGVSNDALTMAVDTLPEAWFQVYTRPYAAGADPTIAGSASAAFYLNTNGNLRAWVNTNAGAAADDAWVTVAQDVPLNQWLAFAVHIDYTMAMWDLYYSTSGQYGKVMKLANTSGPLLCPSTWTPAGLANVTVDSEMIAYVDAVAVAQGVQGVPHMGGMQTNLIVKDFTGGFTGRFDWVVYDYTGVLRRLSSLAGRELAAGLKTQPNWRDGDHLRLYTGMGANEYAVSNNAVWGANPSTFFSSTPLPQNVTLTLADNMDILQTSGEPTSGFFPYNTGSAGSGAGALVVTGTVTAAASGVTETVTLNGTGGAAGGWTWFQWRGAGISVNDGAFIDDNQGLTMRDKIYRKNGTSWRELVWDDDPGVKRWEFNNGPVGDIVAHDSHMWVSRQAPADSSITVQIQP